MNSPDLHIKVDISSQVLELYSGSELLRSYPASTAKNGAGEIMDSECTPRGRHVIADKIGESSRVNAVFVGRKETGEIYSPQMRQSNPGRDWILTRIMWLRGLEAGFNLEGNVDSYQRYIYIHGTPDDVDMSVPGSRGCVRMRNPDIIELFDMVSVGTGVEICE